MCIVESKRLVPVIIEEDEKDRINGKKEFELYWPKPSNYIRMVKCEDDNGNEVKYIVLEDEVEFHLDDIKPTTVYYEVNKSRIYDQLKEICK